jgi:hypothetical protein
MKNRSLRLIGLTIAIFATLLPLLALLALNILPIVTGANTPKLLLSKRTANDKALALVQNSKIELYDEKDCGPKAFPTGVPLFFIEEKESTPQDPILDYFKIDQKNKVCQFQNLPELYLYDPAQKYLKLVTLDEANKYNYDTLAIDKLRGKVSVNKEFFNINYSKSTQYQISQAEVTSYSKILGQEVSRSNSMPIPNLESQQQLIDYNQFVLEPLGFVK